MKPWDAVTILIVTLVTLFTNLAIGILCGVVWSLVAVAVDIGAELSVCDRSHKPLASTNDRDEDGNPQRNDDVGAAVMQPSNVKPLLENDTQVWIVAHNKRAGRLAHCSGVTKMTKMTTTMILWWPMTMTMTIALHVLRTRSAAT